MTETHASSKYADFEALREQAIALRRKGFSLRQIRDELRIFNNDLLHRLVKGEPPPDWTKRPRAKDDLRAKARELRAQGMTYDQIQIELGCSKSSISLWVRDMPKPERLAPTEQAQLASRLRWEHELAFRETERQARKCAAAAEIGTLSPRELFLIGVGLYWAEGSKSKPYRRHEVVAFINSDPDMILLYLAWLELLGVERNRLRCHVMIHESADVAGSERYWASLAGIDVSALGKTTLKKHNPKTVRKNIGADYHGCLVVRVLQGADLYQRIEGWWTGIAVAARQRNVVG